MIHLINWIQKIYTAKEAAGDALGYSSSGIMYWLSQLNLGVFGEEYKLVFNPILAFVSFLGFSFITYHRVVIMYQKNREIKITNAQKEFDLKKDKDMHELEMQRARALNESTEVMIEKVKAAPNVEEAAQIFIDDANSD